MQVALLRAYLSKCIMAGNMKVWSTYPQGSFEEGAATSGVWVQGCWGVEGCYGTVLWIHLQEVTWWHGEAVAAHHLHCWDLKITPKEPNFITKNTNQCYFALKISVSGLLCSSVELHLIHCALHRSLDTEYCGSLSRFPDLLWMLNQTVHISLGFYLSTLLIICGGWEFI